MCLRYWFLFLAVILLASFNASAAEKLLFPNIASIGSQKGSLSSLPKISSYPQHARPLVVLDAGHGGDDTGAKIHYFQEKRITLQTTLLAKRYLTEMGYRVILTRSRDLFVPLQRRVSIANRTRAKIFVSIHFNSSPSSDAHGLEVFYYGGKGERVGFSKKLAYHVLSSIQETTRAFSRGTKSGNFHVIRETEMPAVLVEGGFMTHAEERLQLKNRQYLDKIAKGIAQGVDAYFRAIE